MYYLIQTTCFERSLGRCHKCSEPDVDVCPSRKGCANYADAKIIKLISEEEFNLNRQNNKK